MSSIGKSLHPAAEPEYSKRSTTFRRPLALNIVFVECGRCACVAALYVIASGEPLNTINLEQVTRLDQES